MTGLAILLPATVFAGGQQEAAAPTLEIPAQPRQYISPANGDGVRDMLELPFSDAVVSGEEMVIVEYTLGIYEADGALVYEVSEVQPERRDFFGNLFGGDKPSVEIPDTLSWDGTFGVAGGPPVEGAVNGEFVPDGDYTYVLTIIDDAGRFARSAPFAVTVDNTAPVVDDFAELDYRVFSPNDDGVRDDIRIPISASRELNWQVAVLDADGEPVWVEERTNATPRQTTSDVIPPSPFVWDGRAGTPAEPGDLAPEGDYSIVVTGIDRAGNETSATHPVTITLSLQLADLQIVPRGGITIFSPNRDGVQDDVTLELLTSEPDAVVDWNVEVLNAGQVVRRYSGRGAPTEPIVFDGRRADGSTLADGTVEVRMTARLDNGTTVESAPLELTLDTVAPVASMSAQTAPEPTDPGRPFVFGVGDRARVEGSITWDGDVEWQYAVSHDGTVFASGALSELLEGFGVEATERPNGQLQAALVWDGAALVGEGRARDGLYQVTLEARDEAGNLGVAAPARIRKDARTPEIGLVLEGEYLSPLSGGAFGTVTIRTDVPARDLIDEFLFEIRDERDRVVRSQYVRQAFETFDWTGVNNGGGAVADGTYTSSLRVIYLNGHTAVSESVGPIVVDRTSPRVTRLVAEPRLFSPDGDGDRETVAIRQTSVPGDTWSGRLTGEDGTVILERTWDGELSDFTWDGRLASGEIAPDGDYRWTVSSTDNAGNSTSESLVISLTTEPIVVTPAELALSVSPEVFSPDGDGIAETVTIGITAETSATLRSWRLVVSDPTGRAFRTFSGSGNPPRSIRWNGVGDNGTTVLAAFDYPVTLTVEDIAGTRATAEATITTDILVERDGDRLRIRMAALTFAPFSSDLFDVERDELDANLATLRRLASALNRFPDRQIVIEGHAAHVFLEGAAQQREQERTLIPLSRDRATAVQQALIILGVDADRMSVEAYGGARPAVPHSDRDNVWQNRRVEFVLEAAQR